MPLQSAAKFGRTEVLGAGKQTTSESRAKGGVSSSVYGVCCIVPFVYCCQIIAWLNVMSITRHSCFHVQHYATAIGGAITVAIIFFLFIVSSASTAIGKTKNAAHDYIVIVVSPPPIGAPSFAVMIVRSVRYAFSFSFTCSLLFCDARELVAVVLVRLHQLARKSASQ